MVIKPFLGNDTRALLNLNFSLSGTPIKDEACMNVPRDSRISDFDEL